MKPKIRLYIMEDFKIENRDPGKVLVKHEDYPVVVCGEGLLKILSICDDEDGKELIPLKKFWSRFGS